jgi:hypothetical protein
MDPLSKSDLEHLAEAPGAPCVSIFMPAHRAWPETRQGPIRLKNLLAEARERLLERGLRSTEADEVLEPAQNLLSDNLFWRHQGDGLAMFLSRGSFRRYRLPLTFEELVVVAHRYHLKPFLPLLADDSLFYVLALSQNEVRLLRATRHSVGEVELKGVPGSLAEALRHAEPQKQLQFYTGTSESRGRRPAVFHGHHPEEGAKVAILRYLRQVDAGFAEELKGQRAPLVLAGVSYLFPIYREASAYPHLLEEGISGNPDEMKPEELRDRAWEIVGPRFAGARREAAARYRQLAGTGLTSADVSEVVPAAYYGRVDTLFVANGLQRWGYFDPRTAMAYVHDQPARGDGDLLDLAAVQTFLTGGTVYVTDPEEMPADGPVASVFRY